MYNKHKFRKNKNYQLVKSRQFTGQTAIQPSSQADRQAIRQAGRQPASQSPRPAGQ